MTTVNQNINITNISSSGPCGYCALMLCKKCTDTSTYCHGHENGRTVCANDSRLNRIISLDSNRVLLCSDDICRKKVRFDFAKSEHALFASYYPEFDGYGRKFSIYDFDDLSIWSEGLTYSSIVVFVNNEARMAALQQFPTSYQEINPVSTVTFAICSQCNGYQLRFPQNRIACPAYAINTKMANCSSFSNLIPNFYSDSLCRKPNSSHEKKKKISRRNIQEEEDVKKIKKVKLTVKQLKNMANAGIPIQNMNMMPNNGMLPIDIQFQDGNNHQPDMNNMYGNGSVNFAPFSYQYNQFGQPQYGMQNHLNMNMGMNMNSNMNMNIGMNNMNMNQQLMGSYQDNYLPQNNMQYRPPLFSNFSYGAKNNSLFPGSGNASPDTMKRFTNDEPVIQDSEFLSNIMNVITRYKAPSPNQNNEFQESVALRYLETHQFQRYREYMQIHQIDPTSEPLKYYRHKLHTLVSYFQEVNDGELAFAQPSFACRKNTILNAFDLLSYNRPDFPDITHLITSHDADENLAEIFHTDHNWFRNRTSFLEQAKSIISNLSPVFTGSFDSVSDPFLFLSFHALSQYFKPQVSTIPELEDLFLKTCDMLVLITQSAHSMWRSHITHAFHVMVLKHYVCSFYDLLAQTSAKNYSWNRRKVALLGVKHNITYSSNSSVAFLISICNNLNEDVISSYDWFDTISINFMILKLSRSAAPSLSYGSTSSCESNSFQNLISHDFSIPAISMLALMRNANEIMDNFLTNDFIFYLNRMSGLKASTFFANNSSFIPITHALCSATSFSTFASSGNMEPTNGTVSEDVAPFRVNLVSEFPSLLINSSGEIATSKKIKRDPILYCVSNNLQAKDVLASIPRRTTETSSTVEEAFQWVNLALSTFNSDQVDANSYLSAQWNFAISQMFWIRDYSASIKSFLELETFALNTIPLLRKSNQSLCRMFQSIIIRSRGLRFQYSQHVKAGCSAVFFPGQIVNLRIGPHNLNSIYVSFDHFTRAVYLAMIPAKGECWASVGSDLFSWESWNPILYDNLHDACQRMLLRSLRVREYTFEHFLKDIRTRQSIDP